MRPPGPSRRWRSPELAAGCWGSSPAGGAPGPQGAICAQGPVPRQGPPGSGGRADWRSAAPGRAGVGMFGPSPAWWRRLLRPLLSSAAPSRRLSTPVAHPLPGAGRQTSQGKTRDLRAIYPSHLRPHPPGDIGLRVFVPPCPDADASYALPVRQAGTLFTASFRPRLATTPLLFG
jgi:hypothetical protein